VDETVTKDLSALVAEHYAAVYRYAYRLSGTAADAEDLTQQAFLAAQRKLDQLRGMDAARGWLFTIVRNCFLAARRQNQPNVASGELRWDELPEEAAAPTAIDSELLQRALDALPEEYRLVVLMYYFEDSSYREIAETLEIPVGTVMSRLSRAKACLRAGLWGPRLKELLVVKH